MNIIPQSSKAYFPAQQYDTLDRKPRYWVQVRCRCTRPDRERGSTYRFLSLSLKDACECNVSGRRASFKTIKLRKSECRGGIARTY